MEKEERIKKLKEEVSSLRELLDRVSEKTRSEDKNSKEREKPIDILKRIREKKIIDDDIPPF